MRGALLISSPVPYVSLPSNEGNVLRGDDSVETGSEKETLRTGHTTERILMT